ncbi:MAG: UDP-N-acetylmuramoyl-tripeptide--D-alanyl-D-alanine ligase [Holosporaceae bacterium]
MTHPSPSPSNHPTSKALWRLDAVAKALGCALPSADGMLAIKGVAFDSRLVKEGDLFFALKGETVDGHAFIEAAFQKGAVAAVASRRPTNLSSNAKPVLSVDDTQKALERLGVAARGRFGTTRFIALTGSAGKTSTKEALATLLTQCYGPSVFKTPASFNNHIGVPLSLANMPLGTTHGVFELGMNHASELRQLTQWVRPHIALITTVGLAHAAAFQKVEDIAYAKAEIFEGLESGGVAILPRDNAFFDILLKCAKKAGVQQIWTFGRHPDADVCLLESQGAVCPQTHQTGMTFKAQVKTQAVKGFVPGAAPHDIDNMMAVLAVLGVLGCDLHKALQGLAHVVVPKGRGNAVKTYLKDVGALTLIDSSYNANPLSVAAALQGLQLAHGQQKGRTVAVLGDMFELGDQATKAHQDLLQALKACHIDQVVTVGALMQSLWQVLPESLKGRTFSNTEELLAANPASFLKDGDTILIKGSRGMRLEQWLQKLTPA